MERRRWFDEGGESLIEIIAAATILGIAGAAIIGGLGVSARVSAADRHQSTAAAELRNFAESIEAQASGGSYNEAGVYSYTPVDSGKYTASIVDRSCLTLASATTNTPIWGGCPQPGGGAQKLLLQVAQTSDPSTRERLWIVVRESCVTSGTSC